MVTEYLHAGFRVGVVGRLEAQFRDAQLLEERVNDAFQIAQRQIPVGDQTFDLMELGQMRGVQRFVSEHTVDGEQFGGSEFTLKNRRKFKKRLISMTSFHQMLIQLDIIYKNLARKRVKIKKAITI